MVTPEKQYLDLLRELLEEGVVKEDRTGTGTKSLFGRQIRFDLTKGFPLLTTKKVYLKGIIYELLWFLKGSSNISYLARHGVNIWNDWPYRYYVSEIKKIRETVLTQDAFISKIKDDDAFAKKWGELGPVYGVQWRHWKTPDGEVDQIKQLVDRIKTRPSDRRLIVSAWNVADIREMEKAGLPPCHCLFQFYVVNGKLSCQLYQRSADFFLGVPFNIASYSLLTMMIAQVCGLRAGDFVHTFGDVHLYLNHVEQAKEQLSRDMRPLPTMKLNADIKDIFHFSYDDFVLENYNPHPIIKAPIAV